MPSVADSASLFVPEHPALTRHIAAINTITNAKDNGALLTFVARLLLITFFLFCRRTSAGNRNTMMNNEDVPFSTTLAASVWRGCSILHEFEDSYLPGTVRTSGR